MYYQIGKKYIVAAIGDQSAHYPGKSLIGKECTLNYFDQRPDRLYARVDINGKKIICYDIVLLKAPKPRKETP